MVWDHRDYQAHVENGDRPDYPIDLYLAGAAGHRIDSAWIVIETEIGPKVRRVMQFQPIADMTVEDIWGETRARMMAEDLKYPTLAQGVIPAKIIRYRARAKLITYLITTSRRLAIERDRRQRLATCVPIDNVKDPSDSTNPSPEDAAENAEAMTKMQECLNSAYGRLSAGQKFLLTMVYREGMKQKEAGAMIGWSEFKTSRQLAKAIKSLRSDLDAIDEVECAQLLAAGWSAAWETCWAQDHDLLESASQTGKAGVSS